MRCGYTWDEIQTVMKMAQEEYDVVRLVNPVLRRVCDTHNNLETGEICGTIWGRCERCENCTSVRALQTKRNAYKIEFADKKAFLVVSRYVEIDGKPCCLEMASRLDGDFMPDGYSRDEILSSVRIHKEKVYIDPVTGVYNKRYYVEKLSKMDNAAALMFADIKNFKRINENFGHQHLLKTRPTIRLPQQKSNNLTYYLFRVKFLHKKIIF